MSSQQSQYVPDTAIIIKGMRLSDVLHKCSDAKAVEIAESIAVQRMGGFDTTSLEKDLELEKTRMFVATSLLNGTMPELPKRGSE